MTSSATVVRVELVEERHLGASAAGAGGSAPCFGNLCSELMQFSARRYRESNTRALELCFARCGSHGHTADCAGASPSTPALRLPRRLGRRVPRRWRAGLHQHPKARRQIGVRTVWAKVRQIIFAWWLWAIAAIVLSGLRQLGMGDRHGSHVGVRVPRVAKRSAPSRRPRSRVQRRRRRIPDDDCGIDGHSVFRGKRDRDSEQRRRVLPVDAEGASRWRNAPSPSRPTSTGRAISASGSRKRSPRKAKAGVGVKILLDAVGSSTIGDEILEILEKGGCQLAWYNPVRPYSIGRFNHRTHRKSLIVDGRIAFTGGAGIADHWMGHAQDDQHWRDIQIRMEGPAVMPLQTGFAQNWLQATGEVDHRVRVLPGDRGSGRQACRPDDPELARDRRIDGSDVLLPVDRRRAADDRHRESVFRSRSGRHRSAHRREPPRRQSARHGGGHPQRQLDGAAEQRAALRPAAEGGHQDLRVQPHDAPSEDDGRRRRVVNGRARRTSTADRSRTTKRTTSACAMRLLAKELEAIFVEDIKGCDAMTLEEVAEAGRCWRGRCRTSCRCCRNRCRTDMRVRDVGH